ncbi:3-oxoacyl-[acyl-carrier-protein] reductase FabG [Buchnera aphidicola (Anoecia corni)]|uniref:3-oxoacyl-[acyl-carrier-protein] reductase FabG n=1 Tax=Buchnera aphidicola (Anoecia corni) TaxID=2994477 RepID=A0AAT9IGF2_9GAMM
MNFLGKIAIVTGASRGIGKSTAIMLAEKGATVIGTSSTKEGADSIKYYLKKMSGDGVVLEITNIYSIKKAIKYVLKHFCCIDILINNVGIVEDNFLCKMTFFQWEKVLRVNLSSAFYISKLVVPLMKKKKYGRIVTVSSIVGFIGNIGQINYASSKSGLIGFNKSMALELSSKNITVNIVAPGYIKTDMTVGIKKKVLNKIPMKKFGTKEDVANAIIFLSSDCAKYITGQTLHVNGGLFMN